MNTRLDAGFPSAAFSIRLRKRAIRGDSIPRARRFAAWPDGEILHARCIDGTGDDGSRFNTSSPHTAHGTIRSDSGTYTRPSASALRIAYLAHCETPSRSVRRRVYSSISRALAARHSWHRHPRL